VKGALHNVYVQSGVDAGSVSDGIKRWFVGGSFLGSIRGVMMLKVRACGVHVRLMTIGMMSTSIPRQYERSAFAKGVYFCKMRWC
jgi:hypothetical protein